MKSSKVLHVDTSGFGKPLYFTTCPVCMKLFNSKPWEKRVFCSRKCWKKWRKDGLKMYQDRLEKMNELLEKVNFYWNMSFWDKLKWLFK